MGGNGAKWCKMGETVVNFGCLMEKWAIWGLKRSKKHGFDWRQGYDWGRGCIGVSPEEKSGELVENGRKWGEMGKLNQVYSR